MNKRTFPFIAVCLFAAIPVILCSCGTMAEPPEISAKGFPSPKQSSYSIRDFGESRGGRVREKRMFRDGILLSRIMHIDEDGDGTFEGVIQDFRFGSKTSLWLSRNQIQFFPVDDVMANHGPYPKDDDPNMLLITSDKHQLFGVFAQRKTGEYLPVSQAVADKVFAETEKTMELIKAQGK